MWNNLNVEFDSFVKRATFCGWNIPCRYIRNHELVLIIKGKGTICIEEQTFEVTAGDLIYFYPGQAHSLEVTQEPCMEFYGVHFDIPANMDKLPLPDICHPESVLRLEALFKTLHEIHRQKPYLYRWQQNLTIQRILCEIFSSLHTPDEPMSVLRVRKALAYIHENPCRPIRVETLLELAGVQKTVFMEAFRSITGTTPCQYVLDQRLEYARDLLLESTLSVTAIAERCGFSDSFYFSRCFKKRYFLSPLQYRKQNRLP